MEEFMQFSDQIRLRTAALSLGPTIWSDDRRNLDTAAATAAAAANSVLGAADANLLLPLPNPNPSWTNHKLAFANTTLNRYNNNNSSNSNSNSSNDKNSAFGSSKGSGYFNNINNGSNIKSYFNKAADGKRNVNYSEGKGSGKKKSGNGNNNDNGGAVDKRFKTLPPTEALPRNEAVGGYIFVCNNDTMQENLKRQLFGLPPRYRDSVRAITPGLPLFLYNYSTHQLHGIFEAASFGGTNIDPTAWEDKKCPSESRFPAQVRVMTRKISEPLEEDSFRPILHHYDGPKFRLELSVPEALALLDIFAENNA